MAELQRHLWSTDRQANLDYFTWKYENNPYIHEPLVYLAETDNAIVGMRGAFGTRWEFPDGRKVTLPYADDLVVHPAHRRRGLHELIMTEALRDLAARGFEYLINLSANTITTAASLQMQWRDAGNLRPLRRRTSVKAAIDRGSERIANSRFIWRYADAVQQLCHRRFSAQLLSTFKAMTPLVSRDAGLTRIHDALILAMVEAAARVPRDGRIHHLHDAEYLSWRYANPMRDYHVVMANGAREYGYLVVQCSRELLADPLRVNIVDWQATDPATMLALYDGAPDLLKLPELWCWASALPPGVEDELRRRGFAPVDRVAGETYRRALLIRALGRSGGKPEWTIDGRRADALGNWSIRMINSMVG